MLLSKGLVFNKSLLIFYDLKKKDPIIHQKLPR